MVTAHRDRSVFRASSPTACLHIERLFSDLDFVQRGSKVRVFLKPDLSRYIYLVDQARSICEQLDGNIDNITIVKCSGFVHRPLKAARATFIRYQYAKTRMTRETAPIGNVPDEVVELLVLTESTRARVRALQFSGTENIEIGDFFNLLPWI